MAGLEVIWQVYLKRGGRKKKGPHREIRRKTRREEG